MRRLLSTAFYLFRYALLSATLLVIGGVLTASLADASLSRGTRQVWAAVVIAALLLPAAVLPRSLSKRRRKPRPRPSARRRAAPREAAPRRAPAGSTDGHDFEQWVAQRLETHGWRADVTSGSGDQGIDIIATRDGRKVGIQCKRYAGAVGNKAVQEAFSGRAFHRVDVAVVITTGYYTDSAKALSRHTGVHLLQVKDIPRLRKLTRA